MATPFSSTTHALANDPYQNLTRIGLFVALILMLAWGIWFLFGTIHHYVNSQSARIERQPQPVWRIPPGSNVTTAFRRYTIEAYFLPKDFQRIRVGQEAAVYFTDHSTLPPRPFVTHIESLDSKTGRVRLYIEIPEEKDRADEPPLQSPQVEVAVYDESPAAFLLHTVTRRKSSPISSPDTVH